MWLCCWRLLETYHRMVLKIVRNSNGTSKTLWCAVKITYWLYMQYRHHVVPVRRVLYFVRLKYRGSKTWSTVKTSKENGDNQFCFTTICKKLQKLKTHMKICMTKNTIFSKHRETRFSSNSKCIPPTCPTRINKSGSSSPQNNLCKIHSPYVISGIFNGYTNL